MDEIFMKRALELAEGGRGKVNPNPMVGAVIVKAGKIVGEGYHEYFGGNHAEVNALNMAGERAKGAEVYVTLEPCSHFGKTPPCAKALIKAGVRRVIVAMEDPNPLVNGNGIKILRKAGIEVLSGLMKEEAEKLNEVFIKYVTKKLPFVVMKTAATLDGKISTVSGESKWISCEASREYVHNLRNNMMGIMVGIGTIMKDNPLLTTRLKKKKGKSPTAIILDSNLRLDLHSRVLDTIAERKIIVATCEGGNKDKLRLLKGMGISVIETPAAFKKVDLNYLMRSLGEAGIDSILLEGGSTLNFSCLKEKVVDKVMCFISPKIVGGEAAKTSVGGAGIELLSNAVKIKDMGFNTIGQDILVEGYIKD